MNNIILICLLISVLTGIVFLILGYLLANKQHIQLINGVDFNKLTDPIAFTTKIGNSSTAAGLVILLNAAVLSFNFINLIAFTLLFSVACCLPLVAFIKAKSEFAPPEADSISSE